MKIRVGYSTLKLDTWVPMYNTHEKTYIYQLWTCGFRRICYNFVHGKKIKKIQGINFIFNESKLGKWLEV